MQRTPEQLKDRAWLEQRYLRERASLDEIAKEVGCTASTVSRSLSRLEIQSRLPMQARRERGTNPDSWFPLLRTSDWLTEEYVVQGRTLESLSEEIGCSVPTIRSALRRFSIPQRRAVRRPVEYKDRAAVCDHCHAAYDRTGQAQRYCSAECRDARRLVPDNKRKYRKAKHEPRTCEWCARTFTPSGSQQRFCSVACRNAAGRVAGTCEACGSHFQGPVGQRFCDMRCKYQAVVGSRRIDSSGYVKIRVPKQRAGDYGWMPEHRYVIQQFLGRPLEPWETVHHINGDKADNRLENLQLRSGRHGKGVVRRCGDCGSANIVEAPLH